MIPLPIDGISKHIEAGDGSVHVSATLCWGEKRKSPCGNTSEGFSPVIVMTSVGSQNQRCDP